LKYKGYIFSPCDDRPDHIRIDSDHEVSPEKCIEYGRAGLEPRNEIDNEIVTPERIKEEISCLIDFLTRYPIEDHIDWNFKMGVEWN